MGESKQTGRKRLRLRSLEELLYATVALGSAALATALGVNGHLGLAAATVLVPGLAASALVFARLRAPLTASRIGLGATVEKDAQVMPGATVEMGATVGRGAVIESGAVVRMGAWVQARAVIEAGAVVSWGADVKAGARVGAGARIGAGSTVAAGAVVPANTWVMPGGDFRGGDRNRDVRFDRSARSAQAAAAREATSASPSAATLETPARETPAHAAPTPPADPRQVKLDALFTRIDAEVRLASPAVREQLGPRLIGVRGLRATCEDLLQRERGLRAEASPDALARLDAEKRALTERIARIDDEPQRLSLASAVAAIDEQRRQRQLLARSADRLDAEQTRLFWTLEALVAQLVRMRSAGAELAQSADAELARSLEQLQREIAAITEALEQVAADERLPASPESLASPLSEAPPPSSDPTPALPVAERTRG